MMLNINQARLHLANLPTRIEPLERTSRQLGRKLWIKRDDQTGLELSGNKVRKLEFSLAQALAEGCDTIVTTGGIQSNHCRATAAACVRLGLRCVLILSSDEKQPLDGNYLLDDLFGARVLFIPSEDYRNRLPEIMGHVAEELTADYKKPYLIPIGASNGIGTYGYFAAMAEILDQEKELGVTFDTIVCAVGSAGTYTGLLLANAAAGLGRKVVGVPISADSAYFRDRVLAIADEFRSLYGPLELNESDIHLIDGYVGRGYALSTAQELESIRQFARTEGIVLDPVYTGKAMRGLLLELAAENPLLADSENILFIHTGGLFGLFPKRHQF